MNLRNLDWQKKNIFNHQGQQIRKLFVVECSFKHKNLLRNLLNAMSILEKIVIFASSLGGDFADESKLPELSSLKTIEIGKTDYGILDAFRKSKITTRK